MASLGELAQGQAGPAREEHWIPLSDLMTGLMMMFMLIAIIFMVRVEAEADKLKELMVQSERQAAQMKEVAEVYTDMREQLYYDLLTEFQDDLPRWGRASIEIWRSDLRSQPCSSRSARRS